MKAFRGFLFCILFLTFCLTRKNYFPQSIYLCSMEWLINLFVEQSALQAVIILSLITAIGLGLGKIHICGISLGVTFVFFTGILAGHLGLAIDPQMLSYAESFGLVLFVYSLGLQVGPGFFSSFQRGGYRLNLLGLGVIFLGTIMAVVLSMTTPISLPDMVGILCGATTNTPALGAAQQTLKQLGEPTSGAALSCAVTYPLGVVGVIFAIVVIRKFFVRPSDMQEHEHDDSNHTYIATFQIHNPAIFNKSIQDIAQVGYPKFVISRLWREGTVSIPTSEKILKENDRILVITTEKDAPTLTILFGEQEKRDWNKEDIDWNAIDSKLISKHIIVTRPEINGKKLGSLRLRNTYGINISRVLRSGVQLLATPGLVLQLGDRLTVVGEAAAIPIAIPGISSPVKLGLAGGPIVIGILIGAYGPRLHLVTYTTRSANLMLRGIGLSLYLACLGLDAGAHFFETVMRPEGALWVGIGFLITFIPVVIMALVSLRLCKMDFGNTCGMLCGSMANPMALNYANDTIEGDNPSVSYATVYPLCMFLRVIIIQVMLMVFL